MKSNTSEIIEGVITVLTIIVMVFGCLQITPGWLALIAFAIFLLVNCQ